MRPFLLLFLLFPVLELFVFVQVSGAIGFFPALLLIIAGSMLGVATLGESNGNGVDSWFAAMEAVKDRRCGRRTSMTGTEAHPRQGFAVDAAGSLNQGSART